MNPVKQTSDEAGKALDTLAALSMQLACHCDVPPHTLVLPAGKLREACQTIDEAVAALKEILRIAHESDHGPAR